jgi:hypothetical protein
LRNGAGAEVDEDEMTSVGLHPKRSIVPELRPRAYTVEDLKTPVAVEQETFTGFESVSPIPPANPPPVNAFVLEDDAYESVGSHPATFTALPPKVTPIAAVAGPAVVAELSYADGSTAFQSNPAPVVVTGLHYGNSTPALVLPAPVVVSTELGYGDAETALSQPALAVISDVSYGETTLLASVVGGTGAAAVGGDDDDEPAGFAEEDLLPDLQLDSDEVEVWMVEQQTVEQHYEELAARSRQQPQDFPDPKTVTKEAVEDDIAAVFAFLDEQVQPAANSQPVAVTASVVADAAGGVVISSSGTGSAAVGVDAEFSPLVANDEVANIRSKVKALNSSVAPVTSLATKVDTSASTKPPTTVAVAKEPLAEETAPRSITPLPEVQLDPDRLPDFWLPISVPMDDEGLATLVPKTNGNMQPVKAKQQPKWLPPTDARTQTVALKPTWVRTTTTAAQSTEPKPSDVFVSEDVALAAEINVDNGTNLYGATLQSKDAG